MSTADAVATETGLVLFVDVVRGFGFLMPDSAAGLNDRSRNLYFSLGAVVGERIAKGDRVRFTRGSARDGRARALDVEVSAGE